MRKSLQSSHRKTKRIQTLGRKNCDTKDSLCTLIISKDETRSLSINSTLRFIPVKVRISINIRSPVPLSDRSERKKQKKKKKRERTRHEKQLVGSFHNLVTIKKSSRWPVHRFIQSPCTRLTGISSTDTFGIGIGFFAYGRVQRAPDCFLIQQRSRYSVRVSQEAREKEKSTGLTPNPLKLQLAKTSETRTRGRRRSRRAP